MAAAAVEPAFDPAVDEGGSLAGVVVVDVVEAEEGSRGGRMGTAAVDVVMFVVDDESVNDESGRDRGSRVVGWDAADG